MFKGSYTNNDVVFLLNKINDINFISIKEKEQQIKNGTNYGDLLSFENKPTQQYMDLYYKLLEKNIEQFIIDLDKLVEHIILNFKDHKEIVLVSFARAGTPIGILVKNILNKRNFYNTYHYSISIIKGKGLDTHAMDYICKKHKYNDLVFIDGWISKGSVYNELLKSLENYNYHIQPHLYVINDLAGITPFAGSNIDYLIPNALLNATISGLISRTVYNDKDFHSCHFYEEYKDIDQSNLYIEYVLNKYNDILTNKELSNKDTLINKELIVSKNETINGDNRIIYDMINEFDNINELRKEYLLNISKHNSKNNFKTNNIKVGISETTRVALRRETEKIILKDVNNDNTLHLIQLSKENNFIIEEDGNLPYNAVGIIK